MSPLILSLPVMKAAVGFSLPGWIDSKLSLQRRWDQQTGNTLEHLDKVVRFHDKSGVGAAGRLALTRRSRTIFQVEIPASLLGALHVEREHGVRLFHNIIANGAHDRFENLVNLSFGWCFRLFLLRFSRRRLTVRQKLVEEEVRQ